MEKNHFLKFKRFLLSNFYKSCNCSREMYWLCSKLEQHIKTRKLRNPLAENIVLAFELWFFTAPGFHLIFEAQPGHTTQPEEEECTACGSKDMRTSRQGMRVLSFPCCQEWDTPCEPGSLPEGWKNNHFFLQQNCEGSTGSLYYLRNLRKYKKAKTSWLLLRAAALRLEVTLTGIITSWFEFFGCCLSRTGKQICTPCNKLLTALTLRKAKVWSLLAGERVFVCQPFPQLEERCS